MELQSAMEYLMTYGWAILAIAIVMVSLYSLGIFNTGSLQPTATPGSCEIVRTAAQTSLAGQCSNMIPKYVGGFNGANSKVAISPSSTLKVLPGNTGITVSAWIYLTASQAWQAGNETEIVNTYTEGYTLWYDSSASIRFADGAGHYYDSPYAFTQGKWYNIIVTVAPGVNPTETYYMNGVLASQGSSTTWINSTTWTNLCIGSTCSAYFFKGLISNVQVYNTSLDGTSAKALYQEGIGGVPIDVDHVVGWWPLNGNANDYSGNDNQGTITNVTWNANWQNGYSQP